jgi:hypothetical protein
VRPLRIALLALVAAPIATAAIGGRPDSIRLPAALIASTGRGEFAIQRDGRIGRLSRGTHSVPGGGSWSADGLWIKSVHGHVAVGRWHRTLWSSVRRIPHASDVGDVVLDRRALAFAVYWPRGDTPRLYVARLGGREHLVARNEFPWGWTTGGLYVGRADGPVLFRSATRVQPIAGTNVRTATYAPATHSLYFVTGDRLARARGNRVVPVADLADFGLRSSRNLQLQRLGRLVVLQSKRRLVVLRPDGSLFASTSLPRWRRGWPWITGEPTAGPIGVAFAVLHAKTPSSSAIWQRGVETVYVLRPGARAATPIFRERLKYNVCGHGAELAWHGRWLLYSTDEGPAAAIDVANRRTIELTSLVRRLPGFRGDDYGPFSVAWR